MKNILQSFQIRLTLLMVLSMSVLIFTGVFIFYNSTVKIEFENQRLYLKSIAQNISLMVKGEDIKQIPLDKSGINTRPYQVVSEVFKRFKTTNPQIEDIYTLTPTQTKNIWKFIVDLEATKPNGVVQPASIPGDTYDASRFGEMVKGLNEPSADLKLETDEYGTTLSGYAPIRDELGEPVAVLGVDIDENYIYAMRDKILKKSVIFILFGIILAVVLSAIISARVVGPIKKLKAGTDLIKKGNWQHKVNIPGGDEISQLAGSFNEMADSLEHYRQLLRSYFFDSVKSMALLLEAKDRYTLGHSQSVARYSEKIALRMGIDSKLVEYFKSVVLLHDIGKVGVKDHVLFKTDKLTDEEYNMIKEHPVLGEQILKPLLDDPLMLSVIRHHHERIDGKGYPDGLSENKIPLLVAIVTVADSYDAMTSNRSYRQAMSKEAAIAQLVKNRGTQFHPQVVDAFLEILKEDHQQTT